jgi:hypothetical protein
MDKTRKIIKNKKRNKNKAEEVQHNKSHSYQQDKLMPSYDAREEMK